MSRCVENRDSRGRRTHAERVHQRRETRVIGAIDLFSDQQSDSLKQHPARARCERLESDRSCGLGALIGAHPSMRDLFARIERVAPTSVSVLLTGESGTGKELAAQTIHELSGRRTEPFVAVNCGAIPATLVEAELFGYERGSFTGAVRSQAGYFERAGRGTLFLDEAAEMPLEMQVKLLRALESRTVRRVGGDRDIPMQARVVAATNRSLSDAVSNNHLRTDLLYRLAVFQIDLPSLRERGEDVRLLGEHFLDQMNQAEQTTKFFSQDSLIYLHTHVARQRARALQHRAAGFHPRRRRARSPRRRHLRAVLGARESCLRGSDVQSRHVALGSRAARHSRDTEAVQRQQDSDSRRARNQLEDAVQPAE